MILAVVGFIWNPGSGTQPQQPTRRFAVEMPNSGNTRQGDGLAIAISSDGRSIVTRAGAGTDDMLYIRSIDDYEPKPIEGTTSGRNPFFSPDGEWLAFVADGQLAKVRLSDGTMVTLTPAEQMHGGHWSADGTIVFGSAPLRCEHARPTLSACSGLDLA